ncbi:hypothetical protein [Actinocrispum wychmicini]|uniref:Tetratricopeptide repeat protein n=1 Tax=Actinocrispum wychmicini TaxID=1213861 RepID=A0A4R2J8M5_9PSEU|nr:hypothetical protein [Actinocrispum wychmicini]TCO52888.1 hypothetical protein EV192_11182 [Actinocrispum wychmicini]
MTTTARLHMLAQAALCFEQAGRPADAARCRDRAGEPVAAAELWRAAGEEAKAADCYRRAGRTGDAAACLLALGRPEDAAELWREAGRPLEAAWILAVDARQPQRTHRLVTRIKPAGRGEELRLRLTVALCAALERRPESLVTALRAVERELAEVTPASEQDKLVRWAVQAADHLGRPDLAAQVFAAAYRCRVRGVTARWREWARSALGGTAGVPERDL